MKSPVNSPKTHESRNYQMCILSAIAISFVILGHVRFGILDMSELGTFYGWFPYYSFHLPIFLFISGYFFKDISAKTASAGHASQSDKSTGFIRELLRFFLHKVRNLLLPYYIFTGLFLLFNMLLISWGFTWPQRFSLQVWLIRPWTRLYTLSFAVPAWYLIALFIAEMYFMFLRLTLQKLLKKILKSSLAAEIVFLLFCLAFGILALQVNQLPGQTETASVYLRSVLMLFFMQAGFLYRRYLEKKDTLGSVPYFLLLFLAQFLIILISGNSRLSPGLYGLIGFESFGYDYFLAGLTGIALYLRISRLLSYTGGRSRLILFISANTRYIMAFHILGFFLLNALIKPFLSSFQDLRWHEYLYYTLTKDARMIPLYLFAGLGISLLIAKAAGTLKHLLHKTAGHS